MTLFINLLSLNSDSFGYLCSTICANVEIFEFKDVISFASTCKAARANMFHHICMASTAILNLYDMPLADNLRFHHVTVICTSRKETRIESISPHVLKLTLCFNLKSAFASAGAPPVHFSLPANGISLARITVIGSSFRDLQNFPSSVKRLTLIVHYAYEKLPIFPSHIERLKLLSPAINMPSMKRCRLLVQSCDLPNDLTLLRIRNLNMLITFRSFPPNLAKLYTETEDVIFLSYPKRMTHLYVFASDLSELPMLPTTLVSLSLGMPEAFLLNIREPYSISKHIGHISPTHLNSFSLSNIHPSYISDECVQMSVMIPHRYQKTIDTAQILTPRVYHVPSTVTLLKAHCVNHKDRVTFEISDGNHFTARKGSGVARLETSCPLTWFSGIDWSFIGEDHKEDISFLAVTFTANSTKVDRVRMFEWPKVCPVSRVSTLTDGGVILTRTVYDWVEPFENVPITTLQLSNVNSAALQRIPKSVTTLHIFTYQSEHLDPLPQTVKRLSIVCFEVPPRLSTAKMNLKSLHVPVKALHHIWMRNLEFGNMMSLRELGLDAMEQADLEDGLEAIPLSVTFLRFDLGSNFLSLNVDLLKNLNVRHICFSGVYQLKNAFSPGDNWHCITRFESDCSKNFMQYSHVNLESETIHLRDLSHVHWVRNNQTTKPKKRLFSQI